MQLINYENEITKNYNDLMGSLKNSVEKAYIIGKLLLEKKNTFRMNNSFLEWIEISLPFGRKTAERWIKIYTYKMLQCHNLQAAYKMIEDKEKDKRDESEHKKKIDIEVYKKTGLKPDNWDRATEYRYKKQIKDKVDLDERIRIKKEEMTQSKIDAEIKSEAIDNFFEKHKQKINERIRYKSILGNQNALIDVISDYVSGVDGNNLKLETLHNIIKYCKDEANKLQRESIK